MCFPGNGADCTPDLVLAPFSRSGVGNLVPAKGRLDIYNIIQRPYKIINLKISRLCLVKHFINSPQCLAKARPNDFTGLKRPACPRFPTPALWLACLAAVSWSEVRPSPVFSWKSPRVHTPAPVRSVFPGLPGRPKGLNNTLHDVWFWCRRVWKAKGTESSHTAGSEDQVDGIPLDIREAHGKPLLCLLSETEDQLKSGLEARPAPSSSHCCCSNEVLSMPLV